MSILAQAGSHVCGIDPVTGNDLYCNGSEGGGTNWGMIVGLVALIVIGGWLLHKISDLHEHIKDRWRESRSSSG